jgi:uncharacterized membrane protein
MTKNRLEAFSDGVIAILITIMVLELHHPGGGALADALDPKMLKSLLMYLLSFVMLGIYWNNHHHLLHAAGQISGGVLWANLNLLFWLSLIPFLTGWIINEGLLPLPTALYGVVLLLAALSYQILLRLLIRADGPQSKLAEAVGQDLKGWLSVGLYVTAVMVAWVMPLLSAILYVVVAIIWLVPDPRIEKRVRT